MESQQEVGICRMNRLVSVIIPAYNASRTIVRALESVLGQEYEPLEVLIVDDASTDGTGEIVRRFTDRRVRLIKLDTNRGAAGARNVGIHAAQGEYIAFLDADDIWLPSKLSCQTRVMEQDEQITLVTSDSLWLSHSGELLRRDHERDAPASGPEAWKMLLAYTFITTPTVLARRRDLVDLGGFSGDLPVGEDQDLWIRLLRKVRLAWCLRF